MYDNFKQATYALKLYFTEIDFPNHFIITYHLVHFSYFYDFANLNKIVKISWTLYSQLFVFFQLFGNPEQLKFHLRFSIKQILLYPHTPHQPQPKPENTSLPSYSDFLPYLPQTQNACKTA